MGKLTAFFRRKSWDEAAHRLYVALVNQARQPGFYKAAEVPDTIDGRFELIVLHAFLLMRRLKEGGASGQDTAQALFDTMFADMDQSLREMGVGDIGVGKRVKVMAKGFYGRVQAYEAALATPDAIELEMVLSRNLFGTVKPSAEALAVMGQYVRRETARLAASPFSELLKGQVQFGPAPTAG